jgi:hypothetical protein
LSVSQVFQAQPPLTYDTNSADRDREVYPVSTSFCVIYPRI